MIRNLTNNPLLPRRCRLLLHPNRLCAAATSSTAAGEIAPAPAANETPLEDDLAEELRSRLVRDTCRLLELRDSWSAKLEAQLRHLLRALTPPQVRAVLRAQAQRDARAAFEFFRWADRQWKYRHAPEVFDEMLALLSRTRLHDPARRIMRLMIWRGMRRGTKQFAHLMLSYSRAGKLRSAMRVLQLMQKDGCAPDICICNVAVNVLVVAGRVDKALEFAERMRRVGVDLDVVTYNCLIKGLCGAQRIVDALDMIGSMLQNGCLPDKVSYFTVMSFLCKEKRVAEVRNLLERMRNDAGIFPDQVMYNMLIHGLAKHGHADEALSFLRESEGKRFRVDEVGYSAIVHSFCLNGRMAEAKEIIGEMISKGCRPDVVTYSTVVDGFCRIGELEQARKMMKHMYKNGCKPNTVTHTALLNGLCKVGKSSEAWELLNKSEEEWWTPSDITYSVVMHGFRREGKLKESCDVVMQMLQKGFFPTTVEINLLIHALCKERKPADAKDFMEQCQSKGCFINVVNFTTVIHGFSRQGRKAKMKEATALVEKMLNRGLLPTPVTYRTVIHRYCEKGAVEDLLNLLDKMLTKEGFSSAYNQVIEKLCAFGKLSEAYNLLSKVLRTASKRDAQTCHILMDSFLNRGLPLQSYNVACRMFQRNLIPDLKLCQKIDSQLALAGERQAAGKLITKFVERGDSTSLGSAFHVEGGEPHPLVVHRAINAEELLRLVKPGDRIGAAVIAREPELVLAVLAWRRRWRGAVGSVLAAVGAAGGEVV
ncbi:unnamed protein product [Miscanthus lutarioriparius]|uniref:Pentatricopeptide repeat-containing protein n=1 Tax=Miscanthus lutarioriparius TaxID=422564 RepID=A0A811RA88_9POAL|nr:unnamed protein product [Miscanthus lutarioriparius]